MALDALGLIGFGNIARTLVGVLEEALPGPLGTLAVLVRPDSSRETCRGVTAALAPGLCRSGSVHVSLDAFVGALGRGERALVVECAGHDAVRTLVPGTLAAGLETVVVSVGALGDEALRHRLRGAATTGRTRLVVPSGAIGALDVVAALRRSGIESVRYRGRKPPTAWRGTPAETVLDLSAIDAPTTFYEGSARDAVRDYPANANVAAALSLAGIGFDATSVTLIADPALACNVHEFDVRAAAGNVSLRIEGRPSPDNPKTSLPTVYSVAREVLNRVGPIVV